MRAVFARYSLAGIFNSLLGFGIILVGRRYIGDLAANALAYLLVVPLSFLSHRDFSFRDRGALLPALARYLLVVVTGYAINLAMLTALRAIGVMAELAQIASVCAYVGLTYLASRHFVFRNAIPT